MEVILLERVEKLGQMGEVVKVKSGFARNFLLPQKKALRATDENRRQFEDQRAQLEATNLEHRKEAEKTGEKMDGLDVVLIRQAGEAGQLYGSVNARDISAAVTEGGFTISRQQVRLKKPIKALGVYPLHIDLHPEVSVNVTANVARSEDEAKIQAKTGQAVVTTEEEEHKHEEEAAAEAAKAAAEEIFEEGAAPDEEALTEGTAADHSEEEQAAEAVTEATEEEADKASEPEAEKS